MGKETVMPGEGYARLCFSRNDFAKVNDVFGNQFAEEDLPEGRFENSLSIELDEAEYGLEDQRRELKTMGVAYEGYADPVCGKDAVVFASIEGNEIECETTQEKHPVARVYPNGTVDKEDLEKAKFYHRIIGKLEVLCLVEKFEAVKAAGK